MALTNVDELDGVLVTFLASMLVPTSTDIWTAASQSFSRGDRLVLTDEIIRASRDRFGNSFWSLLDDPEAQARVYGSPRFTRGEASVEPWERRGDPTWTELRRQVRQAAHELADDERARAFRAIDKRFGPAVTDGQTLAYYRR